MGTVLAAVLLLATAWGAESFSWKACDDRPADLWKPDSVSLTPDPPAVGSTVTFTLTGTSDRVVPDGTIEVAVAFMGTPIFEDVKNLCKTTKSCPIQVGKVSLSYSQELPPIAPPGSYEVQVVVKDNASNELMCVVVEFDIVPPSMKQVGNLIFGGGKDKNKARVQIA